jgi:hypothetical protein
MMDTYRQMAFGVLGELLQKGSGSTEGEEEKERLREKRKN